MARLHSRTVAIVGLTLLLTATAGGPAASAAGSPSARSLVERAIHVVMTTRGVHIASGLSEQVRNSRTHGRLDSDHSVGNERFANPVEDREVIHASLAPICLSSSGGGPRRCTHRSYVRAIGVRIGLKVATRVGKKQWSCSRFMPSGNYFGPNPWGWVHVNKYPDVVNRGSGVFRRIAVWRIVASGPVKIQTGESSTGKRMVRIYSRATARTTFLISQSHGTLLHVSSRASYEPRGVFKSNLKTTIRLTQWMRFSNYGESLHIRLPAACR